MSADVQTVAPDRPSGALPAEMARLLGRGGHRLRRDRAVNGALVGLTVGLGVALAIFLIGRVRPWLLQDELTRLAIVGAVGGLLVGVACGLLWPASRRLVAVRVDRVLGLRERISTALELHGLGAAGPLSSAQVSDAVATAATVGALPRLGPRIDRRVYSAIVGLAGLTTLAIVLPNSHDETIRQRRDDAAQVEEARERVEAVRADVAVRTDLAPAIQAAMLERLDELADALEPGEIDALDAQAELAAAEGDLRRLEERSAPEQARAPREAAPLLQTSGATSEVGNALAAGDLNAAAAAMTELGERARELSPEEQQALADRLNELAARVQATNPELAAALAAAAAQLAAGDSAAAAASLARAGAELSSLAAALAANAALSQTSGALSEMRSSLAAGELSDSPSSGQSGASGATGSSTPGAGQSSGDASAAGATPGSGSSGTGAGQSDSGSQGAGAGSMSGSGQVAGSHAQNSTGGGAGGNAQPRQGELGSTGRREEEAVYAPDARSGSTGGQAFVPGQEGEGNAETGAQTGGGVSTDATVPYTAVYGEYADQASREIEQGAVPAPLQPYVRDYFSALDPGAETAEDETP